MNILISGGTGFIGRALVPVLLAASHHISIIGRDKQKIHAVFANTVTPLSWQELSNRLPDEFDAVINLAGANIADKRWTPKYKEELVASRVYTTTQLANWCGHSRSHKPHLYNASAIGYYGLQTTTPPLAAGKTESDSGGGGNASFSSDLVSQWEAAAQSAAHNNVPVTIMRFGVVLRRGEGMLKQLEWPTKLGMATIMGSGTQPISWIDADDLIAAISFLLAHPEVQGIVNLTAPEFVSQKEFTKTLAATLHRPVFLTLPQKFVSRVFGQMGDELLLAGQAVSPARLEELQFTFQYPSLAAALKHEFGK